MSINSRTISLKEISAQGIYFQIPVYQRLYVWGVEQVKTLLDDLRSAWQDNHPIAYLGGILVVERRRDTATVEYDLIDGQQRFTTLWLLALAFREELAPFLATQHGGEVRLRLGFPIRADIEKAFRKSYVAGKDPSVTEDGISSALAEIDGFRATFAKKDLQAFTRYLFDKVTVVMTDFPPAMDLNKMFEVINNRGMQLQHHDILKARLLHLIPEALERDRYAALWESCAYMDDYVERNLRRISGIKPLDLFDNSSARKDQESLARAVHVLKVLKAGYKAKDQAPSTSLISILRSKANVAAVKKNELDEESEQELKVRSIVSFSMLLQHTLRIWLHEASRPDLPRVQDKDLLALFDAHFFGRKASRESVLSFIELLWEVRYVFDKHVIKWVSVDGEDHPHHLIQEMSKKKSKSSSDNEYMSLIREQGGMTEFALLQSMLYHSQQITTHYWLTPLLAHMRKARKSRQEYLSYLKHLDNHLHCTTDPRPLVEKSRFFLENPDGKLPLVDVASYFSENRGVRYPHYWFYKLEFVLWSTNGAGLSQLHRASFRITAKNSVEHISPQNPDVHDDNPVSDEVLDSFGNLALVSRGINSEYGNMTFRRKQLKFVESNRQRIDSLKLKVIYEHKAWGDVAAKAHQLAMVGLLSEYMGSH